VPSRVHFSPPGGLRLPADRKVTSMDLLTRMVEHHVWLVGELLDRAEALTVEQLEAPVEISVDGIDDDPTVRSLLARLVGQLAMWTRPRMTVPRRCRHHRPGRGRPDEVGRRASLTSPQIPRYFRCHD
jgi:hypothetical protein